MMIIPIIRLIYVTVKFINVPVSVSAVNSRKLLKKLLESIECEEYTYEPKEKKRIDWTSYDHAQIHEIDDMLRAIKNMVDLACMRLSIAVKPPCRGRPPIYPGDKAKAILMQQYFGTSNRVTEGFMILFKEKLGIEEFSYKTVERAYDDLDVRRILCEVSQITQEPVSDKEHIFSSDGTGLPTSIKQNYEREKREKRKEKENNHEKKKKKCIHGFEQAIITAGIQYKMIASFIITENPYAAEGPYLEEALSTVQENYSHIRMMLGDAAYLSRKNTSVVAAAGAIPRFYPKKNVTLRAKGSPAWKKMLYQFIKDPQSWLRQYHQRSISESVNSAFMRMFEKKLTRRIRSRRITESIARACDYNIKRCSYLRYLAPHLFKSLKYLS
jgi:transposase